MSKTLDEIREKLRALDNTQQIEYEREGDSDGPWFAITCDTAGENNIRKDWMFDKLRSTIHNVYLAGKIAQNDWRGGIVKNLRNCFDNDDLDHNICHGISKSIFDLHTYTGPFFISCDHGCSHGPDTHGVANSCCSDGNRTREQVVRACMQGIRGSTLMFAWIDCITCYGTLSEIGYFSAARRITRGTDPFKDRTDSNFYRGEPKLVIGLPDNGFDGLSDLWFTIAQADYIVRGGTPAEAFNKIPLAKG